MKREAPVFAIDPAKRHRKERAFRRLALSATWFGIVMLAILVLGIFKDGLSGMSWNFLEAFPSRKPAQAGFKAAIWGSLWAVGFTGSLAASVSSRIQS